MAITQTDRHCPRFFARCIASRHVISNRYPTTHTFAYNNPPLQKGNLRFLMALLHASPFVSSLFDPERPVNHTYAHMKQWNLSVGRTL